MRCLLIEIESLRELEDADVVAEGELAVVGVHRDAGDADHLLSAVYVLQAVVTGNHGELACVEAVAAVCGSDGVRLVHDGGAARVKERPKVLVLVRELKGTGALNGVLAIDDAGVGENWVCHAHPATCVRIN
jgi:hypothetical protein